MKMGMRWRVKWMDNVLSVFRDFVIFLFVDYIFFSCVVFLSSAGPFGGVVFLFHACWKY